MDGIVPHEEDEHVRDTSPFTTCELQTGSLHLPPGPAAIGRFESFTTFSGGGSAGRRIKRTMWESLMSFLSLVVNTGMLTRVRRLLQHLLLPSLSAPLFQQLECWGHIKIHVDLCISG